MGKAAKGYLLFFLLVFCLVLSAAQTQCSLQQLVSGSPRFFSMLWEMFPPDRPFFLVAAMPLWETVRISFLGTFFGAVLGAVGTFLCNSFVNREVCVRVFLKGLNHLFRCIPVLVLALLCTFFFGLGSLAGIIAISLSTGAVLTRLGYEDSENADARPACALEAMGPGRLKAFAASIWKQVLPGYLNNVLYLLESNVRNASVLGFVGAGGIGLLLNEQMAWREYGRAGTILCLLFLLVLLTESVGESVRYRLVHASKGAQKRIAFFFFPLLLLLFCSVDRVAPAEMNFGAASAVFRGFVSPDTGMFFSLRPEDIPCLLWETFNIAFLGTVTATIAALFFSFFSSFRFFGKPALFLRAVLLGIRSVPVLIWGLVWIRVTGPGAFAGVLTLTLCSIGFLAKRFLIAIESIDLGPYRALRAAGVTFLPALRWGVFPQLKPHYVTAILYRMDINLREAAALGLVGAGGIGTPLFLAMNHYEWEQAGALLWGLILLVTVVGFVSEKYREGYRLKS